MESEFLQQMSEMKEKADKYEYQKKRNEELIQKLKEISNMLIRILLEHNPTYKSSERKHSNDDILKFCIKWMESGQYLTLEDIYKAFPDRNKGSISQTFYGLKKLDKNYLKTRIGTITKYYIQKA